MGGSGCGHPTTGSECPIARCRPGKRERTNGSVWFYARRLWLLGFMRPMEKMLVGIAMFCIAGCATVKPAVDGMCRDSDGSRDRIAIRAKEFLEARGMPADWSKKGQETFGFEREHVAYLVFFDGPPVGYLFVDIACDGRITQSTINAWGTLN